MMILKNLVGNSGSSRFSLSLWTMLLFFLFLAVVVRGQVIINPIPSPQGGVDHSSSGGGGGGFIPFAPTLAPFDPIITGTYAPTTTTTAPNTTAASSGAIDPNGGLPSIDGLVLFVVAQGRLFSFREACILCSFVVALFLMSVFIIASFFSFRKMREAAPNIVFFYIAVVEFFVSAVRLYVISLVIYRYRTNYRDDRRFSSQLLENDSWECTMSGIANEVGANAQGALGLFYLIIILYKYSYTNAQIRRKFAIPLIVFQVIYGAVVISSAYWPVVVGEGNNDGTKNSSPYVFKHLFCWVRAPDLNTQWSLHTGLLYTMRILSIVIMIPAQFYVGYRLRVTPNPKDRRRFWLRMLMLAPMGLFFFGTFSNELYFDADSERYGRGKEEPLADKIWGVANDIFVTSGGLFELLIFCFTEKLFTRWRISSPKLPGGGPTPEEYKELVSYHEIYYDGLERSKEMSRGGGIGGSVTSMMSTSGGKGGKASSPSIVITNGHDYSNQSIPHSSSSGGLTTTYPSSGGGISPSASSSQLSNGGGNMPPTDEGTLVAIHGSLNQNSAHSHHSNQQQRSPHHHDDDPHHHPKYSNFSSNEDLSGLSAGIPNAPFRSSSRDDLQSQLTFQNTTGPTIARNGASNTTELGVGLLSTTVEGEETSAERRRRIVDGFVALDLRDPLMEVLCNMRELDVLLAAAMTQGPAAARHSPPPRRTGGTRSLGASRDALVAQDYLYGREEGEEDIQARPAFSRFKKGADADTVTRFGEDAHFNDDGDDGESDNTDEREE